MLIAHKSPGRKMSDHPSPRHSPDLTIPLLLDPGLSTRSNEMYDFGRAVEMETVHAFLD
jgi:hypothetical protein